MDRISLLDRNSLGLALMAGLALGTLRLISIVVYRLFLSPLAKFPGPKIAAATGWYEAYYDIVRVGHFSNKITEMHDKYGPIVRVNPDELHIRDPKFFDDIYAKNPKVERRHWEKKFGTEQAIIVTADPLVHRRRRGALAPMFSRRSIVGFQDIIHQHVETLSARITQFQHSQEPVIISNAFPALTGDIIMDYFFGFNYDQLKNPSFESFHEAYMAVGSSSHLAAQFPIFYTALNYIPQHLLENMQPALSSLLRLKKDQLDLISRTLQGEDLSVKGRHTVFRELLDSKLPPEDKSQSRLADDAQTIVAGGIEATGFALSVTTFHIVNNPRINKLLHEELVKAMPNPSVFLGLNEIEKLPYLRACIYEGLRHSYGGAGGRNPRTHTVPLQYKEWTIPSETTVSMSMREICQDETLFPDHSEYIPERWLNEPRTPDGTALEQCLPVFGRGPRSCLGINLAWMELYLAIGMLFRRFEFELYETDISDVKVKHDFFFPSPRLDTKGVRLLVTKIHN